MGILQSLISRRSFVKGLAAMGASATFVGCAKDNNGDTIVSGSTGSTTFPDAVTPEDLSNEQIYWATGVHNCGTGIRCASKLHVANGRLVRVTSDDSDYDYTGTYRDKNDWTDSRALTCTKCKSYKYRLYHAGRLKYPLKQTKQRGDVTGFVRIKSENAMTEVATKARNIFKKYGPGAFYNTYGSANGYGGTFSNCGDARTALTNYLFPTRGAFSDYSYHQYNYACRIVGHPDVYDTYGSGMGDAIPHIAGVANTIVSWGSNIMTTNNHMAYPYIRAVELMKARNENAKVYHISPEFVDTGVVIATDWVQLRNYTDAALIMGMMHEMIVNTFNPDGSIMQNPYLDVNYIDTFVQGFFDSPAYWVSTASGTMSLSDTVGSRKINAVGAGQSLSAYIMGNDPRLQNAAYSASANYVAQTYADSSITKRNQSPCSQTVKGTPAYQADLGNTQYRYKKDLMTAKTPEWAEKICGTPAATIRELAKTFCTPSCHPIVNEWCGGVQKQDNGVVNIWAISALMSVTKTIGLSGEALYGPWAKAIANRGTTTGLDYLDSTKAIPPAYGTKASAMATYRYQTQRPGTSSWAPSVTPVASISCKEWFNAIKVGFMDTLKSNGYTGQYIPNWDGSTRYVNDDPGAKTSIMLKYKADGTIATYTDANGLTYYDFEGRDANGAGNHAPVFVGTRMIINSGGGIQGNQHFNMNDTWEMYRTLPVGTNPSDPDTFCLVTFDNFLTPTARAADYVFPATIALEAGDWTSIAGQAVYRPAIVEAPGETKDGWRYAFEAYQAQTNLGSFSATIGEYAFTSSAEDADAQWKYIGTYSASKTYQSGDESSAYAVELKQNDATSRFYGMDASEIYATQLVARKNQTPQPTTTVATSTMRANLDNYLDTITDDARKTTPFVFNGADTYITRAVSNMYYGTSTGHTSNEVAEPQSEKPLPSGKLQIFNDIIVWDYEHRFSKYHGWLPADKRGQTNKDREGDPVALTIPIYWNFEDRFNEAYGVFDGKSQEITNGLTLSTTHDRYRVHSSLAENPFLRELNHRTKGGKWASGNDWNEFATVQYTSTGLNVSPMISNAIYGKNKTTASWHEVWMNTQDAKDRGISDGDLIQLENPIGKVRVVARVSNRCIRGHINLHQGSWYDPNPADGVDDGGNPNTLMSCMPSRYDNGNSQQMALVTVKKVNF